MPYWQLFYHLVWATKDRDPLLTPDVEPLVHGLIRAKVTGLGGTVFALGGIPDHVHLVAAIPPSIAVATFVGQVKAATSANFNKRSRDPVLYWQSEYGVFSLDNDRMPFVVAYVNGQQRHHAEPTLIALLERTSH